MKKIDIKSMQAKMEKEFVKRFTHNNYVPAYLTQSIDGYTKTNKGNKRTNQ